MIGTLTKLWNRIVFQPNLDNIKSCWKESYTIYEGHRGLSNQCGFFYENNLTDGPLSDTLILVQRACCKSGVSNMQFGEMLFFGWQHCMQIYDINLHLDYGFFYFWQDE